MNKYAFLWITIGMLVISNILMFYFNSKIKQTIGVNSDSNYIYGILENSYKHMQVDGNNINDSIVFSLPKVKKYEEASEPFKLYDILKGEKIVFYFPSIFCSTCISDQLHALNKLSKEIGEENIVILTDKASDYVMEYILSNNVKVKIYETRGVDIGLPFKNDYDLSLGVFMLTNNQTVKTSFILSTETKEYVKFFYRMIKDKYASNTASEQI